MPHEDHNEHLHVHLHIADDQLHLLAALVSGGEHLRHTLATILSNTEQIMTAISDFAAKQTTFNDQMDTAVSGLTDDVKNLNDQIAELQASPGTVTPEDQALLDGITARAQGIADKLTALDALTPPKVPAG